MGCLGPSPFGFLHMVTYTVVATIETHKINEPLPAPMSNGGTKSMNKQKRRVVRIGI